MNNISDAGVTTSHEPAALHKISNGSKILAHTFSYVLHPIFIPLYVTFFLAYIHPSAFSGFSDGEKRQTLLIVSLNAVFFPLMSVLLLKAVGFIQSIHLRTQKDRIIPYMACGIFFFWTYTVFKEQSHYPTMLTSFMLGIFLAASLALLANIYFKISMHAIGMGGWIGFFLIIFKSNTMLMTWPLAIVLLLSGIICTARLLLSTHNAKDVYAGLFAGMLTQFAAAAVLM